MRPDATTTAPEHAAEDPASRPSVVLLPGRHRRAEGGHPWIYSNEIRMDLAAKALMREGGVIACDASRHPWPDLHPAVRTGLIETARRLDPLVLRWGR